MTDIKKKTRSYVQYSEEYIQQKAEEFIKVLKTNPIIDPHGKLRLGATMEQIGIPIGQSNLGRKLSKIARDAGYQFSFGNISMSLELGPKTKKKYTWAEVQKPAVYAIVCAGSGRMYIGKSRRPDLRRAVHKYWLNHVHKYGSSNVFFGVKAVIEDVEKFGPDNFYMEILHSFDENVTDDEMKVAEYAEICKLKGSILYNIHDHPRLPDNMRMTQRFIDMDVRAQQAFQLYDMLIDELDDLNYRRKEERPKRREEALAARKAGYITAQQLYSLLAEISEEGKTDLERKKQIQEELKQFAKDIKELNKTLMKEYS